MLANGGAKAAPASRTVRAGSGGGGRRPAPARPLPSRVPAGTNDPRDEVVTLSRMRLAVAGGMMASLANSASVWTSIEVDFDNVDKVRRKYKDLFKKETGASLSYLPFVSRATVDALRAFPTVNSSIDIEAKTMTLHPYVNLGIAVDLDQQGLVVPVVKDADALNMRGIAKRITELAGAARGKKLGAEDMKGSTFTITNPGPFASYASSPIINQPNVAILCTDGVKRRPVAVGRRHRHPPDRHHRPGLRPPCVRRVHGVAVPDAHPGLARAAELGVRRSADHPRPARTIRIRATDISFAGSGFVRAKVVTRSSAADWWDPR